MLGESQKPILARGRRAQGQGPTEEPAARDQRARERESDQRRSGPVDSTAAFPGHARNDIQSGQGVVHNSLLFG